MAAKKAPAKKSAPAPKKSGGKTGSANAAEKRLMDAKKKKDLENLGINSRFAGTPKRDSSFGTTNKSNTRRVTSNIPSSPGRATMSRWDKEGDGGRFVGTIRGLRTEPIRSEKISKGDPRSVVAVNMAKPGSKRLTENAVVQNKKKKKK